MIQACIFDLDGTLSDTLRSIAYTSNRSLEKEGLLPLPEQNYRYYAGNGAKELVRAYLAATRRAEPGAMGSSGQPSGKSEKLPLNAGALSHDPRNPADFDYYYESYLREFERYCMYEVKPYRGIVELLRALKQKGLKLAVCSNKPDSQAKAVVEELFGADLFGEVHGQREGVPRKPSPAGPLQIAEAFGVAPENCLYLGDTNTDMQTGKAAGMFTVGVLWGFRDRKELEENHADAIVAAPSEVLALLEQLNEAAH